MIIHMEGGQVHCCGSPAKVLAELKTGEESATSEGADYKTHEKDTSANSKEQASGVSTGTVCI